MNPREQLAAGELEQRSRLSRLLDELYRWRWWLTLAGIGLVGVAAWQGWNPTVPRWAKVVGLAAVVVGVVAAPYAARLVAWLYSPNNPHLVNIESDGNGIEVWELPPDEWRELEVVDDELHPLRALFPTWEVKSFDPEENVAVGTWRAGATDLELVVQQGKARSVQGRYERYAREGLGYRAQYSSAVVAATRNIVLSTLEAFESEALYDGEEITEAVEAELADFLDEEAERAREDAVTDDETDAEPNRGITLEWVGNGNDDPQEAPTDAA